MKYDERAKITDEIKAEYSYMDIYCELRKGIEEKVYMPGTKLPSENKLSTQYNVKRYIVRKVIQKLIADGLVFAIRNKGYYVRINEITVRIRKESNYTQSMLDKKLTPRVKLLEIKIVSPDSEQKRLFNLKDGDMLWELYVLRYYKNIPYLLGRSYIPYNRAPEFNLHFLKTMSIHKVLREIYGIKPVRKSSICRTGISSKKDSRLLSIYENSPILKVTNINVDQDNNPIEQCISTFRADIVQISVNL